MRMELGLYQRLEQRMILAPQMIMSMEILQLATMDLKAAIDQNLVENPVLEVVQEDGAEGGTETASEAMSPTTEAVPEKQVPDHETEMARLEGIENSWNEYFEAGGGSGGTRGSFVDADGKDRKLDAMQNTAARPATLVDHLTRQLHMLDLSERQREIGEFIIGNINENGYLPFTLDELTTAINTITVEDEEAAESGPDWPPSAPASPVDAPAAMPRAAGTADEIETSTATAVAEAPNPSPLPTGDEQPFRTEELAEILVIIQTMDPPGIGARDLQECLLIQIGRDNPRYAFERLLIEKYLPAIESNKLMKICKETGESLEIVKEAIAFLRYHLNPRPGAIYAHQDVQYVVPDVTIEDVDGRYELRLENTYIPQLKISNLYRRMLQEEKKNPKVYEYLKKKVESAKWLIDAIQQRQNTLERIAREITHYQKDFLDHGLGFLHPLKMQQIADAVGIHVSTVSRAVADKYIQTPRGIFALKYFFTGGTMNADGEMESTLSIKQKIKDMVEAENKAAPLSDDEITARLKEQGLTIARRTVTKYRKQLKIPSSRQRKEF